MSNPPKAIAPLRTTRIVNSQLSVNLTMRIPLFFLLGVCLSLSGHAAAASATDPDPLDPRPRAAPPSTSRTSTARGPLPDPALLDGSSQPKDKKSEYGMLGEFEIPGSDQKDSKSDGASDPNQSGGGGGKQSDDKSQQSGGGGQSQSASSQSGGGGGGGSSSKSDQAQSGGGGGGGPQSADASKSGGGASGAQSAKGSGGGSGAEAQNNQGGGGSGDAPGGMVMTESGEPGASGDGLPPKPGEMKIGDASMQIKSPAGSKAQDVVGIQAPTTGKDVPQQYGQMASGQPKSNTNVNRGVEKGQSVPPGL